jgi:hypothetical protein
MPDPESLPDSPPEPEWARAFADLDHDLRGIAGAALSGLDALGLARAEADRARTVGNLRSSLRHLLRLAEELHDVADHLAGRPGGLRVAHDLRLSIRRVCDRLADEAALRRVELAFEDGGIASHVVIGNPEAWDRTLERLVEAGLRQAAREPLLIRLEARSAGVALIVPCGALQLPADGLLRSSWAAPRGPGELFGRGLWLARAFLAQEGGALAIEEDSGSRRLVATLPAR